MKKAWRLLAGRGGTDDAVSEIEAVPEIETVPGIEVDPEIVVDSRGWALSWGVGPRAFRQSYPTFPKLLTGLFEEALRRRLMLNTTAAPLKGLKAFAGQLRAALSEARWVCREAVRQVGHRMRLEGLRKGGRNGGRMEPRPARKPALALLKASGAILDESPPRPSGRPGSKIPG